MLQNIFFVKEQPLNDYLTLHILKRREQLVVQIKTNDQKLQRKRTSKHEDDSEDKTPVARCKVNYN